MGRPRGDDSKRRRAQFLVLMAEGMDVVEARKEAKMDADAALRIRDERDFDQIVAAIRAGSPPVAVVVEANQPPASLAA